MRLVIANSYPTSAHGIFTNIHEPEANNCFSLITQVIIEIPKQRKVTILPRFAIVDKSSLGRAQGGILIDRVGPGVGHLNFPAVPGVGISEFLFVLVTTIHFLGWEIQLYLTSHFCPGVGNLIAIFWIMSKSRPMPRRLDIDRCIIHACRHK